MLESIKKLLNKNKVQFDMFNNTDNDNCKSKYNSLMYFLMGYIEDLKNNRYSKKDSRHYQNILKHNKETILMYLNMVEAVLNNQNIDEPKLNSEDLSYINVVRGNFNISTLDGKKIVVTIEADLNKLNELLETIIIRDQNNSIQLLISDAIEKVKKDNYKDISEDAMTIILLNLLMCYNKESIFDQYMASQSSFIDASSFKINSTPNWVCNESSLKKPFFNRYKLIFKSNEDKLAYENDWNTPTKGNDDYEFIFKVLLLGNSNVGKSSLFLRFVDDIWNDTFVPTIGVDFKIKTFDIDEKRIKMQIWDTAGQERFKNIIASYYRGAHGILLIYDVTDKDSFKNLSNWLIEIEKNSSKNVLKVLIGNKTDLEEKRVISYNQAKEFADSYGLKYIETSAKKNLNVNEAFATLGRELMVASEDKRIVKQKQNKKISVAKMEDLNIQKRRGCC